MTSPASASSVSMSSRSSGASATGDDPRAVPGFLLLELLSPLLVTMGMGMEGKGKGKGGAFFSPAGHNWSTVP